MLLTLLILSAKAACPAQYGIGQRRINVGYLCWTRIARGTRSASRLLRSLSVDGSCYVRVALSRTGSWFERSLHVPRKLSSRACQPSLDCSLRQSQNLGCLKDRKTVHDAKLKCSLQAG